MGEWRGFFAFVVVLLIVLAAASWLIRETPDLLVGPRESPVDAAERVPPSEPTDTVGPSEPPATASPVEPTVPSADEAVDAAAIAAAIELASQQEPSEPMSLQEACEGLGGAWREDSRGWCDLPLPSATPVSDTAALHPDMRVPCPQPLEKILEQVVADSIGGDEMRIYLLYRSVDEDLEEIEVNEETSGDVRLIADGLRRVRGRHARPGRATARRPRHRRVPAHGGFRRRRLGLRGRSLAAFPSTTGPISRATRHRWWRYSTAVRPELPVLRATLSSYHGAGLSHRLRAPRRLRRSVPTTR